MKERFDQSGLPQNISEGLSKNRKPIVLRPEIVTLQDTPHLQDAEEDLKVAIQNIVNPFTSCKPGDLFNPVMTAATKSWWLTNKGCEVLLPGAITFESHTEYVKHEGLQWSLWTCENDEKDLRKLVVARLHMSTIIPGFDGKKPWKIIDLKMGLRTLLIIEFGEHNY